MGLKATIAVWQHLWGLGNPQEFLRGFWDAQELESVLGHLFEYGVVFW